MEGEVVEMDQETARKRVREGYGEIAKNQSSCCAPSTSCCSGPSLARQVSKGIGYSDEDIEGVPEGANLGLGCGNPVALASLKEGDIVLDLGSGAGFDCFLAARKVGENGRVIGVDMTAEMLEKARENVARSGYRNVEFRLGEIEHLPVADATIDVIISNCVINLSLDKEAVFREAFRVLKPGGRLLVSDIVLTAELPQAVRESVAAYVGCISGASLKEDYLSYVRQAGFEDVEILESKVIPIDFMNADDSAKALIDRMDVSRNDMDGMLLAVESAYLKALKPA